MSRRTAEAKEGVPVLRDRLRARPPVDPKRVAALIADLNNASFAVRDKAMRELAEMEGTAVPELKFALALDPPLEVRRRLEQLLAKRKDIGPAEEELRQQRALEALEIIATAEARQLLQALAERSPATGLTRAARAGLERLAQRETR